MNKKSGLPMEARFCVVYVFLLVSDVKIHLLSWLLSPIDELADWKKSENEKIVENVAEYRCEV